MANTWADYWAEGSNVVQFVFIVGLMIAVAMLYLKLRSVEDARFRMWGRFPIGVPPVVKKLFSDRWKALIVTSFVFSLAALGIGAHWLLTWNGGDMRLSHLTLTGSDAAAELLLLDARSAPASVDAGARALLAGGMDGYVAHGGDTADGHGFATSTDNLVFGGVPDSYYKTAAISLGDDELVVPNAG